MIIFFCLYCCHFTNKVAYKNKSFALSQFYSTFLLMAVIRLYICTSAVAECSVSVSDTGFSRCNNSCIIQPANFTALNLAQHTSRWHAIFTEHWQRPFIKSVTFFSTKSIHM